MRVQVRLFAGAREAAGTARLTLTLAEGATVETAIAAIEREHPAIARWHGHLTPVVNRTHATKDARLADGDEVALLPPVSGGAGPGGEASTDVDLSLDRLVDLLDSGGAGAVVTFLGIVRGGHDGEAPVEALDFEAWEEEIDRELAEAVLRARDRFGIVDARIHHRLGRVAAGDRIVAIAVSSRHRKAAFDAASFLVDELKRVVPIWKKEVLADGGAHWVGDSDAGVPEADPGRGRGARAGASGRERAPGAGTRTVETHPATDREAETEREVL